MTTNQAIQGKQSCKVDGCKGQGRRDTKTGNKYYNKGYCTAHHKRFSRHGDPLAGRTANNNRTKSTSYFCYRSMVARCKSTDNPYYGGRGIEVCDRWLGTDGYANFIEDMGERPSLEHSIDRLDNRKGYSLENCRWGTPHQQSANRSVSLKVVGVSRVTGCNTWRASLTVRGKVVFRRNFKTFSEAVQARKEAERVYL